VRKFLDAVLRASGSRLALQGGRNSYIYPNRRRHRPTKAFMTTPVSLITKPQFGRERSDWPSVEPVIWAAAITGR
jgi:hypothetical protein